MIFKKVSIIILNWNGWKDTIECLESVYQINYPNYDVIVVDNGSTNDSVEKIKQYCAGKIKVESKFFKYDQTNKPIKVFEISEEDAKMGKFNKKLYEKYEANRRMILIRNKDNYGFTGGNNIAMRFVMRALNSDYILLLNNDTVVDKDFLIELVKVAESEDRIGILQSKILKKDNPKIIDSTGHIFKFGRFIDRGHDEIDIGQYDDKTDIVSACGASCLFRADMVKRIGIFREGFFAYYEDIEFSLRAKKDDWKIKYVPKSIIYHKGHGTSKIKQKFIESKIEYMLLILHLRNWIITLNEYGASLQKFLFAVEYLRSIIMSWVGKRLGRNNIGAMPYLIAFKEFLRYNKNNGE